MSKQSKRPNPPKGEKKSKLRQELESTKGEYGYDELATMIAELHNPEPPSAVVIPLVRENQSAPAEQISELPPPKMGNVTGKVTGKVATSRATKRAKYQPGGQAAGQPDGQSSNLVGNLKTGQRDGQRDGQTDKSLLSINQKKVYQFIASLPDGKTSHREIEAKTGVNYSTLRKALYALTDRGLITKPVYFRDGMRQGIKTFTTRCGQPAGQSAGQTDSEVATCRATPIYSISEEELKKILLQGFELGQWPKLAEIHFEKHLLNDILIWWKAKNILTLDLLDESLWIAEHLLETGKVEFVKGPIAFFRSAFYKGPLWPQKGFKPPTQLAKERQLELLKQGNDQAEALRAEQARMVQEDLRREFDDMMEHHKDSPEYKACEACLNEFERGRLRKGKGDSYMWREYKSRHGIGTGA